MSRYAIDSGSEEHGNLIIFWEIEPDEDAPNPCKDFDAEGEIISCNPRHISHDRNRIEEALEDPDSDAVPLSYFEHGLCRWMVRDASRHSIPDWQWDGTDFAGIWLPDKCLLDEAEGLTGQERRAKMTEWAAQACKIYTQYCNGDVYGYTVKAYAKKADDDHTYEEPEDYEDEECLHEDSCCGCFGLDYTSEEVQSVINWIKEHVCATEDTFVDPAMAQGAQTMTQYEVRMNCEYVITLEADSEEDAITEAEKLPVEEWAQAWSEIEAERMKN